MNKAPNGAFFMLKKRTKGVLFVFKGIDPPPILLGGTN